MNYDNVSTDHHFEIIMLLSMTEARRLSGVRGRGVAPERRPLRGHRPVAEGGGRGRSLHGRTAHLSHLLFLEGK